jgi:hypothetical protein
MSCCSCLGWTERKKWWQERKRGQSTRVPRPLLPKSQEDVFSSKESVFTRIAREITSLDSVNNFPGYLPVDLFLLFMHQVKSFFPSSHHPKSHSFGYRELISMQGTRRSFSLKGRQVRQKIQEECSTEQLQHENLWEWCSWLMLPPILSNVMASQTCWWETEWD